MYLDDRDWSQWLGLYADNVIYWVPAWIDENTETSDPSCQISQIYHQSKTELMERVARVESGLSVTTMPMARTTHFVGQILTTDFATQRIAARANMMVQIYQPRSAEHYVNFGHYEVVVTLADKKWLISEKTVHLKNDLIPALVDFYTL